MAQTLVLRPDRPHARIRIGKLDFTRISAEAGAIAINAAALLLLLAPMSMHVPRMAERDPDVFILPVVPKIPPRPYVEPKKLDVIKPHVVPTTATLPQKVEIQPLPFVDPQPGDTAIDPLQVAKVEPISDGIAPPLAGAHLEYEVAAPPPYPIAAIREGLTGTVMLRVLVDVDGSPIDVQIERSSGHRVLDAAARKQVLAKWRFKPALENGRAVQAIGLIPIDFNL